MLQFKTKQEQQANEVGFENGILTAIIQLENCKGELNKEQCIEVLEKYLKETKETREFEYKIGIR